MTAARLLFAVLLPACVFRSTPGDDAVQREIDRVVCVYELDYADEPLTEEQLACMYAVDIEWTRLRELREWCDALGAQRVLGCYRPSTAEINVTHIMSRRWELIVLRHELLHHLLWCTGQEGVSGNHSHPAFGGSAASPPGSLPRIAAGIEECQ